MKKANKVIEQIRADLEAKEVELERIKAAQERVRASRGANHKEHKDLNDKYPEVCGKVVLGELPENEQAAIRERLQELDAELKDENVAADWLGEQHKQIQSDFLKLKAILSGRENDLWDYEELKEKYTTARVVDRPRIYEKLQKFTSRLDCQKDLDSFVESVEAT